MAAAVTATGSDPAAAHGLPERARVQWRERIDESVLRRQARAWTATTVAHSLPFMLAAAALVDFRLILIPVALVLLIHAWAIPSLYAARGAGVMRPRPRPRPRSAPPAVVAAGDGDPEARALLLLGDLTDDANRRLHADAGLIVERGTLGVWVLGEAGALLVRPGARRVNCYCVRVTDADLPHGDRIAHLLLALRCDERDFATVANLTFSGAPWRLRRRLVPAQRQALTVALERARARARAR